MCSSIYSLNPPSRARQKLKGFFSKVSVNFCNPPGLDSFLACLAARDVKPFHWLYPRYPCTPALSTCVANEPQHTSSLPHSSNVQYEVGG